jgi:hypothetical protein
LNRNEEIKFLEKNIEFATKLEKNEEEPLGRLTPTKSVEGFETGMSDPNDRYLRR